jgi:hypothetical protein
LARCSDGCGGWRWYIVDWVVMSNGKGDKPRPVDKKRYDANYDRIFGKKKESKK